MNRKNGFYWVKFMGIFVIASWDNGWKMFNGARLYDDNFTYIGENPVEPPDANFQERMFKIEHMVEAYLHGSAAENGKSINNYFKQAFNIDL